MAQKEETPMKIEKIHQAAIHLWQTAKYGYDQASWFFWVIGGFAVLGKLLGLAGIAAVGVTLFGFYAIGWAHGNYTKR